MRAITVRAPWAQCVAVAEKVENRGQNVRYRGEIAIHAGLTPDRAACTDRQVVQALGADPLAGAALGAVIAVANLVDCHEAEQPHPVDATCCWPWGKRRHGDRAAFHLVFWDVMRLAVPVPCPGQLPVGWTVPPEVELEIRDQLTAEEPM